MLNGRTLSRLLVAGSLAIPLWSQGAANVQENQDLDALMALLNTPIESASKRVQKSTESPQAVQVLTGDQIRASGVFRLHDLLKLMTNVQVWEGDYEFTRVGIRGVAPNGGTRTVQVLVDGVPLYNANIGVVDIDALPVPIDAIERVEVVRGPSSSLYGANAQLGVISISTRRAKEGIAGSVRGSVAEHGAFHTQGFYSYGFNEFNVTAGFGGYSLRDSGNLLRATGTTRTRDPEDANHGVSYFVRPEAVLGNDRIWALFARSTKVYGKQVSEISLPTGPFPAGTANSQFSSLTGSNEIIQLGWSHTHSERLKFEVKVNVDHSLSGLGPIATVPGSPLANASVPGFLLLDPRLAEGYDLFDYTNEQLAIQANWDPSATLHFVFGADTSSLKAGKSPVIGYREDHVESASGGFVSMDWNLGKATVSLGARTENESLGGSRTSPRGAFVYNLTDTSTLRLGYFTSSRSPQISEVHIQLSVPGRPSVIPNPNLKPEEATNFELGYRKTWARWSLDCTLYQMKLKKLIAQRPTGQVVGGQPVLQSQNGDTELTNKGIEVGLTGELASGWLVGLNTASVNFTDEAVKGQGDYSPKATSNLWTRVRSGSFQGYLAIQHMGSYFRRNLANPNGTREEADAALQVHFNVGFEPWRNTLLSIYGVNAARKATETIGGGTINPHMVRFARRELGFQVSHRF